jgi:hypothetical protein
MTQTNNFRRAGTWLASTALILGVAAADLQAQPGRNNQDSRQAQPGQRTQPGQRQGGQGQPGRQGGRQGGFGQDMTSMFEPDFTSKDLDDMARKVAFAEDQQAAAEALFQVYLEEFNASAEIWQSEIEALREELRQERDFSRMREIPAMMLSWRAEKSKMGQAFQEEIQLLLGEKQQSRWTTWERAYRRTHSLPEGRLAGEQLNLISLIEEMQLSLSDSGEVLDLLGQYEVELDRALQERETALPEVEQAMSEALQEQNVDIALSAYQAGQELRKKVQEVNRRFASRCQAVLPAEHQPSFARKVQELSYPQVFRTTRTEGTFQAVLNLDSLSSDQARSIESLQERYLKDLEAKRVEQIKQIDEAEASSEPRWLERMRDTDQDQQRDRRQQFDPENMPPEFRLRMEMRELEQDTMRHVRDVLSEEQLERLQAVVGDEGGRGFGNRPQRDGGQGRQGGRGN